MAVGRAGGTKLRGLADFLGRAAPNVGSILGVGWAGGGGGTVAVGVEQPAPDAGGIAGRWSSAGLVAVAGAAPDVSSTLGVGTARGGVGTLAVDLEKPAPATGASRDLALGRAGGTCGACPTLVLGRAATDVGSTLGVGMARGGGGSLPSVFSSQRLTLVART